MLQIALDYLRRGWTPVRVVFRGKRPVGENWQFIRITIETAPQYFNGAGYNIGVQLGQASGGLTDLDLDCLEAIAIAPYVMPLTHSIFGRASKRNSHRLYITDLAAQVDAAAFQLRDPRTRGLLVELRIGGGDKGAQTVFPGSVHESGEEVVWEEDGEVAQADGDSLIKQFKMLGAFALLARYWPEQGSRHQAALVVGGLLSRWNIRRSVLREYVGGIAKAAGDPEWRDRRKGAEDAAIAYGAGKHTFGFPALAEMFGRDIAEKVAEWLDYHGETEQPQPNGADHTAPGPGRTEAPPADYKPLKGLRQSYAVWDDGPAPDQQWGVYNRFPLRQSGIMSGEGAVGKSTTLLHLAAAHAIGVDWLGAILERGPAFFIDCEDDALVIRRRLAPICNHYGVRFADLVAGGLELISLVGHDPIMATVARTGKVEPTKRYDELIEMAGDLRPKCIAIASCANVYAGSENDRSQVQQFVGYLTKVALVSGGYLVLAQHPSLAGINNGSGLSGTTQWDNAVRARAYMRGISDQNDEQADSDLREIVFMKNQYGRKDERIVLKWRDGMYLPLPGVWSLDAAAAQHKADEVFIKLLRRFNEQNQDVNASPGRGYAPAVFASHPDAAGLTSKQFAKAMQRLLDAKIVVVETTGPPSRQHKRLTVI